MRWRWYQDTNTVAVWIHLLLTANWEDRDYRNGVLKRGSLVTTYDKLGKSLGITARQARTAIAHLIETREVSITRRSKGIEISIENYDAYQSQSQSKVNQKSITEERKKEAKKERIHKNVKKYIYSDFGNVSLSEEEMDSFKADYPNDYKRLIEELGEYKAKSGKEYKSDYAALISFAKGQGIEKDKGYTIENEFEFLDDGSVITHQVKVFKDGHTERG